MIHGSNADCFEKIVLLYFINIPMVLYICVSFWLLAHESRDLSQVETKIIVIAS